MYIFKLAGFRLIYASIKLIEKKTKTFILIFSKSF